MMDKGKIGEALIGEILAPGSEKTQARREKRVRTFFWKTVRKAARYIPFIEDVVAAYYCALDRHTPKRVRLTIMAALAYFVLPLDFIPDFLLPFGFTDDIAVLMTALRTVRSHITPAHYEAARKALAKLD